MAQIFSARHLAEHIGSGFMQTFPNWSDERQGWIDRREILRPGLEAITMKHVIGPNGYSIDHVTYYVATQFKGTDGLPPVATCAHQSADGSGGTGFMWQPGIWAGTRMNQKHCADWSEITKKSLAYSNSSGRQDHDNTQRN